MNTVIAFVKSHWTLISAIVVAIWGVVGTQVQTFVAMHSTWTVVIGVIAAVVAHISPSPVSYWKK